MDTYIHTSEVGSEPDPPNPPDIRPDPYPLCTPTFISQELAATTVHCCHGLLVCLGYSCLLWKCWAVHCATNSFLRGWHSLLRRFCSAACRAQMLRDSVSVCVCSSPCDVIMTRRLDTNGTHINQRRDKQH